MMKRNNVAIRKSNGNIDNKNMLITWITFADGVNFFS